MLDVLDFKFSPKEIPDLQKLRLALVFPAISAVSRIIILIYIQSKHEHSGMEPWATSDTKLVPGLDDKVLSVIKLVRFFIGGFLVAMSGFGALGLGLGAI